MNTAFQLPESDDLSQLITTTETRVAPEAPKARLAHALGEDWHVEKCKHCRGGRFISWGGRDLGPCRRCKGTGQRAFRHSAEQRARQKAQREARKQLTIAEAIAQFATDHPRIQAWMNFNVTASRPFEFAIKMRAAVAQYGSLTEKQLAACYKCVDAFEAAKARRAVEQAERMAAAPTVNTSKLEEGFAAAMANGLFKPRLRLCGFTISPAKAESKNAGALYVKAGDQYLGKVQGGKFLCVRECSKEQEARVIETLADPEKAAIAFGKETGNCACCGRFLENPESVARGIGPICASKWGWS